MNFGGMRSVVVLGSLFAVMMILAACGSGISEEDIAAKDLQIKDLQSQLSQLEVQNGELATDSRFWTQLTSLFQPVEMPSMTDHRSYMLEGGVVLALQFDNADLDQAENLNWFALGLPGKFCKADQERTEAAFGKGFTHFHDLVNDIHGGDPETEGVWFVHTAVRDFEAPWGEVKQGIDQNFMPTPPPDCA